ncbi:MAG: glycosyltransferase family 2 protein [Candidatus Saccharimonadales bacterium]
MKLAIVSICKNEAKTVEELIRRMPKKIKGVDSIELIVLNDGSTDKTVELAKKAGATVYGDNKSKGLAFRFREVVNIVLERGFDAMANIDGDLQFNPEDIPKFVLPIVNDEADFTAADRFTDADTGVVRKPANMPPVKYYGNKVGAWVVGKLSDEKFPDVTCGFRAYNQKALYALNINGSHTYTQESFQILAARKMRIKAIPVEVKYFKDRKSRVVTSIPKYMVLSIMNILRSFRDFAPLRFFVLLGLVPFIIGLACEVFMGIFFLQTGAFSPYKFVGFTGLYLLTLGLFFWSLGLVADMQVRVLNNQEKTYEELRRLSNRIKK